MVLWPWVFSNRTRKSCSPFLSKRTVFAGELVEPKKKKAIFICTVKCEDKTVNCFSLKFFSKFKKIKTSREVLPTWPLQKWSLGEVRGCAPGQSLKLAGSELALPFPPFSAEPWVFKVHEFYSGKHREFGAGGRLILVPKLLIFEHSFCILICLDNSFNFPFCWVYVATSLIQFDFLKG